MPANSEQMSFSFHGPRVDTHEIELSLLADSLMAFHSLAEKTARQLYGRDANLMVRVKGAPKAGSFEISLVLDWISKNPEVATAYAAVGTAAAGGLVWAVKSLFRLAIWAKGKSVSVVQKNEDDCLVKNIDGETQNFGATIVSIYNIQTIQRDIDKMTRPLDQDGVTSIAFDAECTEKLEITREARQYFRYEGEGVLKDDEVIMILEIVVSNFAGSGIGWRFSDGDIEFTASVQDEAFLSQVKNRKIVIGAGDTVEARVRTIQSRPNRRLRTERIIEEVLKFTPGAV